MKLKRSMQDEGSFMAVLRNRLRCERPVSSWRRRKGHPARVGAGRTGNRRSSREDCRARRGSGGLGKTLGGDRKTGKAGAAQLCSLGPRSPGPRMHREWSVLSTTGIRRNSARTPWSSCPPSLCQARQGHVKGWHTAGFGSLDH